MQVGTLPGIGDINWKYFHAEGAHDQKAVFNE